MNFRSLIKTNALERTVLIMNFISVSLSSWHPPLLWGDNVLQRGYYEGEFQLRFKPQPPCPPQMPPGNSDFAMGHQRCQDGLANWGTNRCSKVCPHRAGQWCFLQGKPVHAAADKRESDEGCQNCWQSCEMKPHKVGNPPCEYLFPLSGIHTEV